MKTKVIHILIVSLLFFTLTSSQGADLFISLLVMLVQFINFLTFGLIGLVLSIKSVTTKKEKTIKTGKTLVVIFSILSLLCVLLLFMVGADSGYILVTTLIEAALAGLSFFLITKAKKSNS